MLLSGWEFKQVLVAIGEAVERKQDELCELDRVIGDGDHGVSMTIGWQAIREQLKSMDREEDIGVILRAVSRTFLNAVGASIGPLYGMAFLRGSAEMIGKMQAGHADLVRFWIAAVEGIRQMGKAEVGNKTMLDTWAPIASVLEDALLTGASWEETMERAVEAGRRGMESTRDMVSQLGRSGRLGERSKGHIDPGAASAFLIFSAFVDACKKIKGAVPQ
jgi:dihydroxyacetone kinase-like protein